MYTSGFVTALLAMTCFSTKTTRMPFPHACWGCSALWGETVNGSLDALLQVDRKGDATHNEISQTFGAGRCHAGSRTEIERSGLCELRARGRETGHGSRHLTVPTQ